MENVLQGLRSTRNISDDIIVGSKNDDEHEEDVRNCLQRLKDKGLTLNFFGNIFCEEGISPDPVKVKAIHEAKRPCDRHEIRSFLGMVNYIQRFIPNLSSIVKPIRELTKLDKQFIWDEPCV